MAKLKYIFSKEISYYLAAIILCLIFLYLVMHLWAADLSVPFVYSGDATLTGAAVKGTIDNGWYLHNPLVGMPSGSYLYDFPSNDNLNMAIMKVISFAFPSWALTLNLYFLLTFPLTVITTLFVLRKIKVSPLPAMVGSLLFAYIPFHFARGEAHLVLAAYFLIPLVVLVIFWIFEDDFLLSQFGKASQRLSSALNWKNILSIIACIAIGSSFFYYPFFSCFFLLVAGVCAAILKKKWIPLLNSFVLIGVIVLIIFAWNIPTLLYRYENGVNTEVLARIPQEAETNGLKIIQLLLPIPAHRIPLFQAITNRYNQTAPLVNENLIVALGIIGGIGFIILILWVFFRLSGKYAISDDETFTKLTQISTLNLAALLLATIGGFGAIFAYLIFPQIRAYNRISIFIAFFSIAAIMLLIDFLIRKYSFSKIKKWTITGCTVVLLVLGILDQTSNTYLIGVQPIDYKATKAVFLSDEHFIHNIETRFPDDTMVFQLPYMSFPENGSLNRMKDYDHFRAYLHSTIIRWSYGAMRGREGNLWQEIIASKPIDEMVQSLSFAGFSGIYVDSYGYQDGGKEALSALSSIFHQAPLASDDGRLYFFDMTPYNVNLRSQFTPEEFEKQKSQILNLEELEQRSFNLPPETSDITYAIDIAEAVKTKIYGKTWLAIAGWAFIDGQSTQDNQIFIVLKSEINQYIFSTIYRDRPDVAVALGDENLVHVGFISRIPAEQVQDGKYKIGICIIKGDLIKLRYTYVNLVKSGDNIKRTE